MPPSTARPLLTAIKTTGSDAGWIRAISHKREQDRRRDRLSLRKACLLPFDIANPVSLDLCFQPSERGGRRVARDDVIACREMGKDFQIDRRRMVDYIAVITEIMGYFPGRAKIMQPHLRKLHNRRSTSPRASGAMAAVLAIPPDRTDMSQTDMAGRRPYPPGTRIR